MKKIFLTLACLLALVSCSGKYGNPDYYLEHYKAIVRELSSETYQGRGYAADGVLRAGDYIAEEFVRSGAKDVSRQTFAIDVNTFYGKMEASVNGHRLIPGRDFVMREYSPGVHGTYSLYRIDTADYNAAKIFEDIARPENKNALVVCDFWFTYKHPEDFRKLAGPDCQNAGFVYTWDPPIKFYKAYAEKVVEKPIVWTTVEALDGAGSISLDIDNTFLKGYESDNIIARVPGTRHDSCYVFTAHYDHLGNLGPDVFYAGANDNASGTAGIITLAEYYAHNRPEYDMWFIAFSGEDTNLRGSTYFAEHPLMPLEQIKYLINLDMIGDNNSEQYCEISDAGMSAFPLWEKINSDNNCFRSLDRGELAANSDHYPFAVRGVPCVFFENEEGDAFKYYHTVDDTWENAVFDSYLPVFRLITGFVEAY